TGGTGPFSYDWTFESGTPAGATSSNPTASFAAPGSYDVSVIVTDANGCTAAAVQNNFVNIAANTIEISANALEGCAPFVFNFSAVTNNAPQSTAWSVLETGASATGANASFSLGTPGTYTVCLDVEFSGGCTAQQCTTVVVHALPTAAFAVSGNAPTCVLPSALSFTDLSTGDTLSYNWSFPGGSPSASAASVPSGATYADCGVYSASLTVTDINGCTASSTQNDIFTVTCPEADFAVDITGGCVPLAASFTGNATVAPVAWEWTFGDGGTSDQQNPSYTYTTEGCFSVTLVTTTAEGCKDTVTYTDMVCAGTPPDVSFTSNPPVACADEPITFINNTTNVFSYTTYAWDFIGVPPYDQMSTLPNPTYVYNDTGWFDVTLIASNYGCNDTLTIFDMEHILPPVAVPALTRSCGSPLVITLSGLQSLGADTYTWTIPGGNPSTATTPTVTVTYTVGGNYSASLYVTNALTGCDHQATINIPVRDVEAEFTGSPLQGCAPLNACMTNQTVDAVSYAWLVTDSATGNTIATSTQTNPCFMLTVAGAYNVRLIATDMFGCRDTIYKPSFLRVWRPTAAFVGTPLQGCTPLQVNFTDTSFAATSTIVSWAWNFGDPASGVNNTSTLQHPTHVYNNPGSYTVTLTVVDNHGCSRSVIKTNYVQAVQPTADFVLSNTSVCSGAVTCFTNASSGAGLTYSWDFGNGQTSNLASPCVTYTDTGWYSVLLTVTNSFGCIDTMAKLNYINVSFPGAAFTADTTSSSCPPLFVQFDNQSFGGATYQWQFGDASVSSAVAPTHIYNQAGSYDVTLVVTNAAGCRDTL
ncbi:MAG TPA: PKD domain-containing protein, partial [Chitinophagales bacterium]|nr:PKD domain-containing protein [Chitinophagales bacterium]